MDEKKVDIDKFLIGVASSDSFCGVSANIYSVRRTSDHDVAATDVQKVDHLTCLI